MPGTYALEVRAPAHYPWKGGMKDFLSYTARWEQETVLQLKDHYDETTDFKQ
jgi:hypothetical protein